MFLTNMQNYIVHYPFDIPELGRQRAIRVLLPRNYRQDKGRRFPVLYLQDGQNLFDPKTAAIRHWRLREFMQRQPLYRQAILVGIDNGGGERIQEYAPYKRGKNGGKGADYLRFVEHTLKPFIDTEYRTWGHREATGIIGSSLGGLLTLYAGLQFGHVFGKVGSLSPSLWFNPAVVQLAKKGNIHQGKFYVSGSKTEMKYMSKSLENVYWTFKGSGFSDEHLRVVIRDRGQHSETFWAREFKPMYEWLFPATAL
jgi:predicted alpha/beta superfamily hydrolase